MIRWMIAFLLPAYFSFAASFLDPISKLSFEVPTGFQLVDHDSFGEEWYYTFEDDEGNELILEITQIDKETITSDHIQTMLGEHEDREEIIFEELDFRSFPLNGLEVSQCTLRIIAVSECYRKPLVLSDVLFEKEHYNLLFSLIKVEDDSNIEEMMNHLLSSIHFSS